MTKKKLYYMHPINMYDTELERRQLWMLGKLFPDYVIVNPNEEKHQRRYENYKKAFGNGMLYFERLAGTCDAGIALAFRDGKFGAGICKEMQHFVYENKPRWEINQKNAIAPLFHIDKSRALSVDETRERIRNKDGSRKPY